MNTLEGGVFNNKSVWSNVIIILSVTSITIFCVFLSAAFDNIENKRSADFIYKINQQRSIVEHISVLTYFFTLEYQEKISSNASKVYGNIKNDNLKDVAFDINHARSELRDLSRHLELIDLKFIENMAALPITIKKFYFGFNESDIKSDEIDIRKINPSSTHKKINDYIFSANKLSQLPVGDDSNSKIINYLSISSGELTKALDNSAALYYQYLVNVIQDQANNHWLYVFIILIIFSVSLIYFVIKPVQFSLEYAYKEAALAKRIKAEFLTSVSHEIRTPMHGIISAGENLYSTQLNIKQSNYVKTVISSAESLLDVVNDILGYSSLDSGDTAVEKSLFNLNHLVSDLVQIMVERAQLKNIEIILRYDDSVPDEIISDYSLLRQIFYHLLSNAIKFTEKGYIVVSLNLPESIENSFFNLRVSIEDTGIGIPQEKLPLIFDEFMQADGATTRIFSGTGLGLSICKRIIDLMNGDIRVSSILGEGSTFTFNLPCEIPKKNSVKGLIQSTDFSPSIKSSILFICDDINFKKFVLSEIGMIGSKISCIDSMSFIQEKYSYDNNILLVCIDSFVKNESPSKILQRANLRSDFSHVPFVCITRKSDDIANTQLKADGFSDVYNLPNESKLLLGFISSLNSIFLKNNTKLDIKNHVKTSGEPNIVNDKNEISVLMGASILLVEDNRINAMLAQDMLEILGMQVTHVENGQIALDRIREGNFFDLILMDCMMPVMDGFKATQEIRQLPQADYKKIPIIALTANAMIGDKERCLNAGMSAYLSKPVRKNDLKNMLMKWLLHREPTNKHISTKIPNLSQPRVHMDESAVMVQPQDSLANKNHFPLIESPNNSELSINSNSLTEAKISASPEVLQENKLSNDHINSLAQSSIDKKTSLAVTDQFAVTAQLEFLDKNIIIKAKKMMKQRFPKMIEYFLEDTQNYINQIKVGITQKDYAQLVVPSHTIKSSARQMGAINVSNLAKEIEAYAHAEEIDFNDLGYFADNLQKQFDLSRIDFNNLLSDAG